MFLWDEFDEGILECLLIQMPVCLHFVSVRAVDFYFHSFPISFDEQAEDSFILAFLLGPGVAAKDNYQTNYQSYCSKQIIL